MRILHPSENIYVTKSNIKNAGRGVFAAKLIKKGELIEECPFIEVLEGDTAKLNESILVTYFFYFGKNKERAAFALGFGALYNHTYTPNATYKINVKEKVMDFTALRDIKKDEEITVNYNNGNPNDKTPLWF